MKIQKLLTLQPQHDSSKRTITKVIQPHRPSPPSVVAVDDHTLLVRPPLDPDVSPPDSLLLMQLQQR